MSLDDRVVVDFDQHSLDYRNRYPEISHELRSKCPVTWSTNYDGYWVVTGLEEVSSLLRRPELFSATKDLSNPESPFRGIQIPDNNPGITAGFLEMDPPLQIAYRHVLNPYLSPSAIQRWEPLVRDFTHACTPPPGCWSPATGRLSIRPRYATPSRRGPTRTRRRWSGPMTSPA